MAVMTSYANHQYKIFNNYSSQARSLNIGEYSPIFTDPEANNYFSVITQVIIREKQEPYEIAKRPF